MAKLGLFFSICTILALYVFPTMASAASKFETDTIHTSAGDLKVTFIGHGTLMFQLGDKVIHVDPWTKLADYKALPKADLVLITHDHFDHLDTKAIELVKKNGTVIVLTETCAKKIGEGRVMKNGDVLEIQGVRIEAVPAYNIVHERSPGVPYHMKGIGNGYVITFGDKRVYVAGDTENIPEMKALKNIHCAFLPMNLPYTMTPEMVADAARSFMPEILYPYHYGDTDVTKLTDLLKDVPQIEVRIRNMM